MRCEGVRENKVSHVLALGNGLRLIEDPVDPE